VAREVGVSTHTIYAWKSKYGGMDVSETQEAKRLRDENARLRKLVADLSLDKETLQSVIEKKRLELTAMKASVEHIRNKYAFTERRACRLLLVPVSSCRYQPRQNDDGLREHLIALAREKRAMATVGCMCCWSVKASTSTTSECIGFIVKPALPCAGKSGNTVCA
jgi:putative transposase